MAASSDASRWSTSTGSISAGSCPALTASPTSTFTLSTRPATVGPIIQLRRASTVPMPKSSGAKLPSWTQAIVNLMGASGPDRIITKRNRPISSAAKQANRRRRLIEEENDSGGPFEWLLRLGTTAHRIGRTNPWVNLPPLDRTIGWPNLTWTSCPCAFTASVDAHFLLHRFSHRLLRIAHGSELLDDCIAKPGSTSELHQLMFAIREEIRDLQHG